MTTLKTAVQQTVVVRASIHFTLSSVFLWAWRCTTYDSIPIILILLANKNVALNYSLSICEQKRRIVHCQ